MSRHLAARLHRLDDALPDLLVQLLDVGQVARGRDRVPQLDQQLARDDAREAREAGHLVNRPRVGLAVVSHLLDHRGETRRRGSLHPVLHGLEPVQDVLSAQHHLVLGDELREGDRRLRAHEPLRDRVEEGALVARDLRRCHAHVCERLVEAVPRRGVRAHRACLNRGRVDAQVGRVLADEVDQNLVDARLIRPLDEVLVRGGEVHHPEAAEEGRVHVVDVVLRAVVDCREDAGLGVEPVGDAVLVVAQLAVEDQLEERLLDAGERAVELIEHDDRRTAAGADEPARHAEGHDAVLLHALDVGVAAHVTLGHGGAADVDVGEAELLGAGLGELALADAGGAAHEDGDVGRELGGDGGEGLDVHDCFLLSVSVGWCVPVYLDNLPHRAAPCTGTQNFFSLFIVGVAHVTEGPGVHVHKSQPRKCDAEVAITGAGALSDDSAQGAPLGLVVRGSADTALDDVLDDVGVLPGDSDERAGGDVERGLRLRSSELPTGGAHQVHVLASDGLALSRLLGACSALRIPEGVDCRKGRALLTLGLPHLLLDCPQLRALASHGCLWEVSYLPVGSAPAFTSDIIYMSQASPMGLPEPTLNLPKELI